MDRERSNGRKKLGDHVEETLLPLSQIPVSPVKAQVTVTLLGV